MNRLRTLIVMLVGVFALGIVAAACSPANVPPGQHAQEANLQRAKPAAVVHLHYYSFEPFEVTIRPGQTVKWIWQDIGSPHNVTFPGFASPTQTSGTWLHTFPKAGIYGYVCTLHYQMTGVVVVKGTSSSSSTTTTTTPTSGAQVLSVAAGPGLNLAYTKKTMTAHPGKVTIDFTNSTPLDHNLTLQVGTNGAILAHTPTFQGGTRSITVTLKAGTYTYFCSVPGHRAAGMFGTLTVRGPPSSASPSSTTTTTTTASTTTTTTSPSTTTSTTTSTSAQSLSLSASGTTLAYNKKTLTAHPGKITISFTNHAVLPHNLTLQVGTNGKILAHTPTFQGGTRSITVTLKAGTYTYFCSVPGHRAAGMFGTLTVK